MSQSNTMTLELIVIAKTCASVYLVGFFRLHVKAMAVKSAVGGITLDIAMHCKCHLIFF